MPFVEVEGKQVEVDEDGFMVDPAAWFPGWAHYVAKSEGIGELTERHWHVIDFLKDYYAKTGIAPMIRKLCKESGIPLKEMYELFPTGPAKGACKCAGLPKPTGCV